MDRETKLKEIFKEVLIKNRCIIECKNCLAELICDKKAKIPLPTTIEDISKICQAFGRGESENPLDKIEFVYGNDKLNKNVKHLYHKTLRTIISIREKYTGLKPDSFTDKQKKFNIDTKKAEDEVEKVLRKEGHLVDWTYREADINSIDYSHYEREMKRLGVMIVEALSAKSSEIIREVGR